VGIVQHVELDGRILRFRAPQKVKVTVPVHPEKVARRMVLFVRPLALPGTAMSVEPDKVEVEILAEPREAATPELASRITLYVEWPRTWEVPADAAQLLGPLEVQVKAIAPSRVQVRGVGGANGEALPTVKVRGALAGALK
jgi:hypothetical protein